LALEFGDVAEVATSRPDLLTPDQRRAVADLDRQMNEMSGDNVWATDALLASEWVTVRELATIALRQLGAAGTWRRPLRAPMTTIYVDDLVAALKELEDERCQRELWLAEQGPMTSSFTEAYSQAFDDAGLADALDAGRAAEVLGTEAVALLERLDRSLSQVDADLPALSLITSDQMKHVRSDAHEARLAVERLVALRSTTTTATSDTWAGDHER
jgi:predicted transcriptional regulator